MYMSLVGTHPSPARVMSEVNVKYQSDYSMDNNNVKGTGINEAAVLM